MSVRHFVLSLNDAIVLYLPPPLINVSSGDNIDAKMRKVFNFLVSDAILCMFTEAQYIFS